jgi:hypothetical protein
MAVCVGLCVAFAAGGLTGLVAQQRERWDGLVLLLRVAACYQRAASMHGVLCGKAGQGCLVPYQFCMVQHLPLTPDTRHV